jgi:parvulin-like peptidyl-prolyl isomerase
MLIAPLAVAVLGSACTTFSDSDAVARVGDDELGSDDLQQLVPIVDQRYALPEGSDEQSAEELAEVAAADADAQRAGIGLWIQAKAVTTAADDAGVEFSETDRADATNQLVSTFPSFSSLSDENRDLLVDFVLTIDTLGAIAPDDEVVAPWFDGGVDSSGIACVSHILVATSAEADDVVAELESGVDFAELAADRSIDPGSAVAGGFLACDVGDNLLQQYVPEFAAAAVAARPGVPTAPVESEFGFHVIRLGTFAESTDQLAAFYDNGYIPVNVAIAAADSYVDPRYGVVEGTGVVALG